MQIYTEKFRPSSLDGVIGQEHVTKYLKEFVKNKDIPNILMSGVPGTGKTSCAIALAKDLFGDDWKKYFYEINASDESGVDIIRNKIKTYARLKVIGSDYKIIFFDEMDFLSKNAQACLRRIIENSSNTCRFIFSCNFPNKVIDAIIDRCVVFRFKAIKSLDMKIMLDKVVESENIDITKSALSLLATLSNGSMRKALNTLQKLKQGNVTNITDDTIYDTICYVNDDHIRSLLLAVRKGDIGVVDKYLDTLLNDKVYAPSEILESLYRMIKDSKVLTQENKLKALTKMGDVEYRIAIGATPNVQLRTYMVYLILLYQKGS